MARNISAHELGRYEYCPMSWYLEKVHPESLHTKEAQEQLAHGRYMHRMHSQMINPQRRGMKASWFGVAIFIAFGLLYLFLH